MSNVKSIHAETRLHAAHALCGNLASSLTQYLTVLILVRNYSEEEVGRYFWSVALVVPLFAAFEMQMRALYVTERRADEIFSVYLTSRIVAALAVAFGLIVLAIMTSKQLLGEVLIGVTVWRLGESIADIYYAPLQRADRHKDVARLKIVRSLLIIGFIGGMSLAGTDICLSLSGAGVVSCAMCLIDKNVSALQTKGKVKIFPMSEIKGVLVVAFPFLVVGLFDRVNQSLPRFILEKNEGMSALGMLGPLFYIKALMAYPVTAIYQPSSARLTAYCQLGTCRALVSEIARIAGAVTLVAAIVLVVVLVKPELLLSAIYGDKKFSMELVTGLRIVTVSAAISLLGGLSNMVLTIFRKTWFFLVSSSISMGTLLLAAGVIFAREGGEGVLKSMLLADSAASVIVCAAAALVLRTHCRAISAGERSVGFFAKHGHREVR